MFCHIAVVKCKGIRQEEVKVTSLVEVERANHPMRAWVRFNLISAIYSYFRHGKFSDVMYVEFYGVEI